MKIGRNDPCHCGSGNKYKKCCLAKDEAARSSALQAAQQEAAAEATASASAAAKAGPSKKSKATAEGGKITRPKGPPVRGQVPLRKHAV